MMRFKVHHLVASLALGAAVAAEELPVTEGERAAGPGAVGARPPQKPPQGQVVKPGDLTTDTKPVPIVEDAPEPETQPSGSGASLPYDFALTGESAVPPDLTLGNSRSFTMGLGPSAFGPGIRSTFTTGILYDDNINQVGKATASDSGTDLVTDPATDTLTDPATDTLTDPGTDPGTDTESELASDLIFSAGLQLQAELGNADRGLALNYAIDGYFYTDHPEKNALNHALGASVYRRWGRTKAKADVGYAHTTGEDRDVGASTTQDTVSARLNIEQGLGARGRLIGGVDHTSIFYETYNNSSETSGRLAFDHPLGSKLHLGIEGVVGVLSGGSGNGAPPEPAPEPAPEPTPVIVTGSPTAGAGSSSAANGGAPVEGNNGTQPPTSDTGTAPPATGVPPAETGESSTSQSDDLEQAYQQVNLTFEYHATDRLDAAGSVGWEWRSTEGGGTDGNFVYDLNLRYRIGRGTTVAARGSRHTVASAAYDDTSRLSTNFELSVSQAIGRRFVLAVAGGYERSTYSAAQGVPGSERQDDYMYLRPSLSLILKPRLSMSLFYDFRKNESTGEGGTPFEGNRIGTQLTYSF